MYSSQSESQPGFRVAMKSLVSINDRSIKTLLRGGNDSRQPDEIQASLVNGFCFKN